MARCYKTINEAKLLLEETFATHPIVQTAPLKRIQEKLTATSLEAKPQYDLVERWLTQAYWRFGHFLGEPGVNEPGYEPTLKDRIPRRSSANRE